VTSSPFERHISQSHRQSRSPNSFLRPAGPDRLLYQQRRLWHAL